MESYLTFSIKYFKLQFKFTRIHSGKQDKVPLICVCSRHIGVGFSIHNRTRANLCISKALTFFSLTFDLGKAMDVLRFLSGVLDTAFCTPIFCISSFIPACPSVAVSLVLGFNAINLPCFQRRKCCRSAIFLGAYASQSVSVCQLSIQSLSLKLGKLHNYSRTTLKRIVRSQSTEQFSGVPCMITLLSCSLYTW